MRSFERGTLEHWLFLTREEWQTLFALQFFLTWRGDLDASNPIDALDAHALEWLQREHGVELGALRVRRDDVGLLVIFTEEEHPVEPRNALAMALIGKGGCPDLRVHVPVARQWLDRNLPDFPREDWMAFERAIDNAAESARRYASENADEGKRVVSERREILDQKRRELEQVDPEALVN